MWLFWKFQEAVHWIYFELNCNSCPGIELELNKKSLNRACLVLRNVKTASSQMANICQKDVETISKDFFIPDVLFSNFNHQELEIFACTPFLGTPNTLLKLSHTNTIYMKHYFLEHCCSFFKPIFTLFTNFSTLQNAKKQVLAKMRQKGPFLTVYTMRLLSDDVTKCKIWTR